VLFSEEVADGANRLGVAADGNDWVTAAARVDGCVARFALGADEHPPHDSQSRGALGRNRPRVCRLGLLRRTTDAPT
jgi:hypothetical protein